jgi:hypothetical protein
MFTKTNIFNDATGTKSFVFVFNNYYSSKEFQGIIPDSETAIIFLVGEQQLIALQKKDPSIQLDISTTGTNKIVFGKNIAIIKSIIRVPILISIIIFMSS